MATRVVDSVTGNPATTLQMIPVEVSFAAGGVPKPVDPTVPIKWNVTGGTSTVIQQPSDDGSWSKVYFRSDDVAGTTYVTMEADAQIGDGVTPLSHEFEFPVADALADTVLPVVGAAVPKV